MFITKRKHQKLLDTLRLEMVTELEGTKVGANTHITHEVLLAYLTLYVN